MTILRHRSEHLQVAIYAFVMICTAIVNGFHSNIDFLFSPATSRESNNNNNNNVFLLNRRKISLNAISNDDKLQKVALPRDVKDAVSKCRAAVQTALQNRMSRMDIEMPVGAKFGVEKITSKKKKSKMIDDESGTPTLETLDRSDRELARLFVEMFQPVGGDRIAVVFSDEALAEQAKMQWKGDPGTESSKIMSISRNKTKKSRGIGGKKKKKKKPMGFAAKLAAEVEDTGVGSGPFQLPKGIEVALFVSPTPKDLIAVERTCSEVGMETLVVLLNARLSTIQNFGTEAAETFFTSEFEQVFSLCAAPQDVAPGCLMYRSYPDNWVLARKPKVGQPKPILVQESRPTEDDCRNAYDTLEIGEVEKGVENLIENVAGWFG